MFSSKDYRQIIKRFLFATVLLAALVGAGILIDAVSAGRGRDDFEPAKDFPRGAVVYAQFNDLPAAIKEWNASALKERYEASVNREKFWSRHLANKLFSRWEEFNEAAGFSLSASALGAVADRGAAIAVYDIGRLDLVLIAPLDEGRFAATEFFLNKGKFEEREAAGGEVYYLSDVEADKGRQRQQIGFARLNGKFALATNEKLLLRAIANLGGQAKKDRLTDDPAFQTLSEATKPHFATVWVNQAALNDDWYFKKYWVMRKGADLKNIRAGIFDLELRDHRWVERRDFLLNKAPNAGPAISKQTLRQIENVLPSDAPYAQIKSLDGKADSAADFLREALLDRKPETPRRSRRWNWARYGSSDFEVPPADDHFIGANRYSTLDYRYNLYVDDPDDSGEQGAGDADGSAAAAKREERSFAVLRAALQPARPTAVARIAQPRAIEGPLFAEFRRAAIFTLENPVALQRAALERSIADLISERLMVAGAPGASRWARQSANGAEWREMRLPMLERAVGYGLRGKCLVVSNSPELLASLMSGNREDAALEIQSEPVHELTVIRLGERKTAFDPIFAKLDEPRIKAYWKQRRGEEVPRPGPNEPSMEFFSGEISSLLDVAAPVDQIRVRRNYSGGRLHEEVAMILK
jgi:hypothetical protein